jgi:hypothetical protein
MGGPVPYPVGQGGVAVRPLAAVPSLAISGCRALFAGAWLTPGCATLACSEVGPAFVEGQAAEQGQVWRIGHELPGIKGVVQQHE